MLKNELLREERRTNQDTVPQTDDPVEYPPQTVCSGAQTDLTALDIAALD